MPVRCTWKPMRIGSERLRLRIADRAGRSCDAAPRPAAAARPFTALRRVIVGCFAKFGLDRHADSPSVVSHQSYVNSPLAAQRSVTMLALASVALSALAAQAAAGSVLIAARPTSKSPTPASPPTRACGRPPVVIASTNIISSARGASGTRHRDRVEMAAHVGGVLVMDRNVDRRAHARRASPTTARSRAPARAARAWRSRPAHARARRARSRRPRRSASPCRRPRSPSTSPPSAATRRFEHSSPSGFSSSIMPAISGS